MKNSNLRDSIDLQLRNTLNTTLPEVRSEVRECIAEVISEQSIDEYVANFIHHLDKITLPLTRYHTFIPDEIYKSDNNIQEVLNKEQHAALNHLILIELINKIDINPLFRTFDDELRTILIDNIIWIEKKYVSRSYAFFEFPKFTVFLYLCTLKSIYLGNHHICAEYIPKGILLHDKPLNILKNLFLFFFKIHGLKPMARFHLVDHTNPYFREFNKEGWKKVVNNATTFLKQNKTLYGLTGVSWFFDPQLAVISPELAYLREYLLEQGGILFKGKYSVDAIKSATQFDFHRRKMMEQGLYNPIEYCIVIPRNKLLKKSGI